LNNVQSPLDTLPRNFPVDGEVANLLRTCWRLGELSRHVKIVCRVAKKSVTSWQQSHCNGIWEMTRHSRHNRHKRTFAHANLLQTCYGLAAGKLA